MTCRPTHHSSGLREKPRRPLNSNVPERPLFKGSYGSNGHNANFQKNIGSDSAHSRIQVSDTHVAAGFVVHRDYQIQGYCTEY